jgi:hypothetical protein
MAIAVIVRQVATAPAISGRLAEVDQLRVFWANWPSL